MNALSLLERVHVEGPKGFVELDERLEWLDPGAVRIAAPRAQWAALTNHVSRRLAAYGVRVVVPPPSCGAIVSSLAEALAVSVEPAEVVSTARAIGEAARRARCAIIVLGAPSDAEALVLAELERAAAVPVLRLLDEGDPAASSADFVVNDRLDAEAVERWWAAVAEEARRASGGAAGLRELEAFMTRGPEPRA